MCCLQYSVRHVLRCSNLGPSEVDSAHRIVVVVGSPISPPRLDSAPINRLSHFATGLRLCFGEVTRRSKERHKNRKSLSSFSFLPIQEREGSRRCVCVKVITATEHENGCRDQLTEYPHGLWIIEEYLFNKTGCTECVNFLLSFNPITIRALPRYRKVQTVKSHWPDIEAQTVSVTLMGRKGTALHRLTVRRSCNRQRFCASPNISFKSGTISAPLSNHVFAIA